MRSILTITVFIAFCLIQSKAVAWDLSSGITLTKTSGAIEAKREPSTLVTFNLNGAIVSVTDFFYSESSFVKPWIAGDGRGKATLHIGTKKQSGLFSAKDEYLREVTLTIDRSRVPPGTTLYILNDDTGEVLGHAVAK